ncbi:MAG: hypothetical protein OXE77_01480 [Flavobacteriaceae bacterium]|nr:hypothetical protein [Flavobacteriaceae bacterium]MCY4267753.1 hypothetical protein [Flavobacteriaceae bacterium]MCY4298022.1 hypothetical protein [Flavobacteriaceae bacterium]
MPISNNIGLLILIVLAPVLIFLIPLYHVVFKQPKNRFCIPLYFFGAIFSFFWGINLAVIDGQDDLQDNVFDLTWTDSKNQPYQIARLYYKEGKPMDLQLRFKKTINTYINEAKKEFYEFLLD